MDRQWATDGFDTARLLINSKCEQVLKEMAELKEDSLTAAKKQDLIKYVTLVLNTEQDLSQWLSRWFERRGVDKDFISKVVINRFELINFDKIIPVYLNEEFYNRRASQRTDTLRSGVQRGSGPPRARTGEARRSSEILVKIFGTENNFYRLDFIYYIDFSDNDWNVIAYNPV